MEKGSFVLCFLTINDDYVLIFVVQSTINGNRLIKP